MDTELEKKAFDCFNNGFCCAESISKTIIDHFSDNPNGYPIKVASGFCGGVGRTFEDICGALAGGVIAIGYLYGRMEQGKDIGHACGIIKEFRDSFIKEFGSTNCNSIKQCLGEQENFSKCKILNAKATAMLADILQKHDASR